MTRPRARSLDYRRLKHLLAYGPAGCAMHERHDLPKDQTPSLTCLAHVLGLILSIFQGKHVRTDVTKFLGLLWIKEVARERM
eukprot:361821-Alexandrium_andersonii.AAC.1